MSRHCHTFLRTGSYIVDTKYTGAPLLGTPILGTHYIVSCDAEVCGAERESSKMVQKKFPDGYVCMYVC